MKLAFITSALYPTRERVHFLDDSCKRQGIELLPHGIGEQFTTWRNMMLYYALPHIKQLHDQGYTHVLYMDGVDSLVLASEAEIVCKYAEMGSPSILFSAQTIRFPPGEIGNFYPSQGPWRFPNAGQWIAETRYAMEMWDSIAREHDTDENPQGWVCNSWPIAEAKLDSGCRIFQAIEDREDFIAYAPKRVFNCATKYYPCVLHFPGGYADPETGRDWKVRPWVERIWR